MADTAAVWADGSAAREQLGRVGVWLGELGHTSWAQGRLAARRIEELGYGALWINESPGGKEPLAHAGLLLGATERITLATGIANIWARDAVAARDGAYALAEAHPGRFTLGLGVSHQPLVDVRGHDYDRPLAAMRGYLDGLDALPFDAPGPSRPVPLVLAALRPRMLRLAGERTSGAHPYFTPAEHTARARAALGDAALLAPEVSIVLEADPSAARERARRFTAGCLQFPNYANNLRDLGFGDEDLAGGGSDRLVDAVVGWGDADAVVTHVRAHLDAGADHVCVQPVGAPVDVVLAELERLAPALLAL